MRPLTLEEFAEDMRRNGDIRQADMADEILALIDIERDVAEPYEELCDDLERATAEAKRDGKPGRQLEWLIDRSDLLAEIEKEIEEAAILPTTGENGKPIKRDTDDAVKELLSTLEDVRDTLAAEGFDGLGIVAGLRALIERAEREAEIIAYDL